MTESRRLLQHLHDYHAEQAKRYGDALQTIRDAERAARKIDKTMARVRAAANGHEHVHVVAPKRKRGQEKAEKEKRRQATARLLRTFSTTEPRPNNGGRGIGTLIRHGFLKWKGDLLLRTDKPFHP